MQHSRIVVLGGGYSGMMAARRLAYKLYGQSPDIVLVDGSPDFVQRIRLHQLAAHQSPAKFPVSKLLQGTCIQFQQGWATQLDPQAHTLTLQTAAGSQPLRYDYLVYALGSHVDMTCVPGLQEHALSLGSEATTRILRDQLPAIAQRKGRLVIGGGGLTGIEAAAELAETYPGLKVTLITRGELGAQLSARGRHYLHQTFDRLHIEVLDNTNIRSLTAGEVQLDGGSLAYDACLWTGVFSVPTLAREAGLKVNARGQITVDDHLRAVSHNDVYAVGDAADLSEAIDTPIRMACATALPMGIYAADALAARLTAIEYRPYEFAYAGRCISLGRHDALMQLVDADDRPKEQIITGRLASLVKEAICRYTAWQVQNPRWTYIPRRPAAERRNLQNAVQT